MDNEKHVFRRQFIFSPRRINAFPGWKREEVGNRYFLLAHPDLSYTLIKNERNFLLLLGYILDPLYPERSDEKIVNELFSTAWSLGGLFTALKRMFGRYIIIASINGRMAAFSDPLGARALFYTSDSAGRLWVASQSSILAEYFGFHTDREIERDLFGIPLFAGEEYWYPGTVTAYREISHLLPNHYLDFSSKSQIRYWPVEELIKRDDQEVCDYVVELWRGAFRALCRRFDSALAISAGLDSRIILAASREVSSGMQFITHTHKNLGVSGPDIVIPSVMLPRLGLKHTIVFHSEHIDPDFERIFRRNVTTARRNKGVNAYALYRHFQECGKECVVINGNGGEITRNFYFLPRVIPLSGFSLASLAFMEASTVAVNQFGNWLEGLSGVRESGYSVLDLLYWEQRIGNWASMSFSEYDISFESFSPFGCKDLLESMLSVSASERCWPDFRFHQRVIQRLWPEVLEYGVNPVKGRKAALRQALKRTCIHEVLKAIRYLRFSGVRYLMAGRG